MEAQKMQLLTAAARDKNCEFKVLVAPSRTVSSPTVQHVCDLRPFLLTTSRLQSSSRDFAFNTNGDRMAGIAGVDNDGVE